MHTCPAQPGLSQKAPQKDAMHVMPCSAVHATATPNKNMLCVQVAADSARPLYPPTPWTPCPQPNKLTNNTARWLLLQGSDRSQQEHRPRCSPTGGRRPVPRPPCAPPPTASAATENQTELTPAGPQHRPTTTTAASSTHQTSIQFTHHTLAPGRCTPGATRETRRRAHPIGAICADDPRAAMHAPPSAHAALSLRQAVRTRRGGLCVPHRRSTTRASVHRRDTPRAG